MLGSVDASRRPLKIPPKFIPYMEKHRIYELFHEIGRQLVIKKPTDHLLYIKQCLKHAARCLDAPRIIILSPPDFDICTLANYLKKKINIQCICAEEAEACNSLIKLVENVENKLKEMYTRESGWVFINFPRNVLEARALQGAGILPTHVVEIIWTDELTESSSSGLVDNTTYLESPPINIKPNFQQRRYDFDIRGLRDVYSNVLITVETGGRTHEDIGDAIITLSKRRKPIAPCYNFRIVLIGPRGSGRRTIAKFLAHKYKLEFIDFDYLSVQVKLQNLTFNKEIECIEKCTCNRSNSSERVKIIENKLLSHECLKKGWVLIGYPITVEDFQMLDLLPTAPNRVIFLSVDEAICKERLLSRKFPVTKNKHNLVGNLTKREQAFNLKHYELKMKQDIQEYFENVEELIKYSGESASIVDASISEEKIVREKVESCLIKNAPSAHPRILKGPKKVLPQDIEFDPDDPIDPKILEQFRPAESVLSLV